MKLSRTLTLLISKELLKHMWKSWSRNKSKKNKGSSSSRKNKNRVIVQSRPRTGRMMRYRNLPRELSSFLLALQTGGKSLLTSWNPNHRKRSFKRLRKYKKSSKRMWRPRG